MAEEKRFLNINDVCDALQCSKSVGYKVIRQLNDELQAKGYIVLSGKVNAQYFNERIYKGGGL